MKSLELRFLIETLLKWACCRACTNHFVSCCISEVGCNSPAMITLGVIKLNKTKIRYGTGNLVKKLYDDMPN